MEKGAATECHHPNMHASLRAVSSIWSASNIHARDVVAGVALELASSGLRRSPMKYTQFSD
jgi:hypothetical protein